jgi:hypothetical protein
VKLYRKDFIEKRYRDWLKALLTVFLIHCHSSVIRSNFTRKYFFKLWNLFNPGLSPSHLYCQSTFWQFLRIRCCNSAKTTLCSCKVDGSPQWLQNFASNLTIVIIGRKREQGTCMTRKKQSFGSIRSNWCVHHTMPKWIFNFIIGFGDSNRQVKLLRMAAPKFLLHQLTSWARYSVRW